MHFEYKIEFKELGSYLGSKEEYCTSLLEARMKIEKFKQSSFHKDIEEFRITKRGDFGVYEPIIGEVY
jgi:hypothetical protein